MKRNSIAILGSRGIPAAYGGFETLVDTVAPRLAEAGWQVFVSCEGGNRGNKPTVYKGTYLFYFPVRPFYRIVYEPLYDIYSLIRASSRCNCIYMLGYGAGLFFFIPRLLGKPLAVNVDGLEWRRAKYNRLQKILLLLGERAAVAFASVIIADSIEVKRYIESKYRKTAVCIPYGVDAAPTAKRQELKLSDPGLSVCGTSLSIEGYWLTVARLEPENNIHLVISAFLMSGSARKLVIVGDSSNARYKKRLAELVRDNNANERVILTGAIYDTSLLNILRQNCFAYIHGHSVGGTNPALLEAMSMRSVIIAHDNNFNREVGADTLLYFKDGNDLEKKIIELEYKPDEFTLLKEAAFYRVTSNYAWPDIVEQYNNLFKDTLVRQGRKR